MFTHELLSIATGIATLAACLVVHACFMFRVMQVQIAFRARHPAARGIGLVVPAILLAIVPIVVSSFIQIMLWSAVLWVFGSFTTFRDALYFSGTTYTTLGTGKHVLVPPYRVLEPIEAMNGILAAGLNTAMLFSILANVGRHHTRLGEFFD